ncbi:uncharacterized protein C8Q71DRAFT_875438 [Rhodofomes roseus]|uniref:ATPase AAA-type core domain-containing protein n=1 Tax=Rhodofomes roseus TaxID=34475 RepID=A0ABQ8K8K4_9APHY|nr:uncharacterized protein C8Q71DRAFT_875431 [Rhodofomes roseus]XP_047776321.1 uncharacterized protein C8Q71DRAFT_875438 [Rhodofomes roseus]KAH9833577.1 hypothetical protein C8Q71DRAFT_875431 [Rhodofomes roseus]KAH9833581.1 hypothetical protein C8Q71DRAFT_875438 [Rhodofomes roseus]
MCEASISWQSMLGGLRAPCSPLLGPVCQSDVCARARPLTSWPSGRASHYSLSPCVEQRASTARVNCLTSPLLGALLRSVTHSDVCIDRRPASGYFATVRRQQVGASDGRPGSAGRGSYRGLSSATTYRSLTSDITLKTRHCGIAAKARCPAPYDNVYMDRLPASGMSAKTALAGEQAKSIERRTALACSTYADAEDTARACCRRDFEHQVPSAIVDKYIGRVVREMFGYARENEPCVIFMDEIDAIGGRRFSEGTRDPAHLDGGRLDGKVEIPLANEQARLEMVKIHFGPVNKGGEIDYEAIVKLANGFNGADLHVRYSG